MKPIPFTVEEMIAWRADRAYVVFREPKKSGSVLTQEDFERFHLAISPSPIPAKRVTGILTGITD